MRSKLAMVPVILLMTVEVGLAQQGVAEQVSDAEIQQLVQQLNADTFSKRGVAHNKLIRIGKPAMGAIQAAMSSESAEVRARAKAIYLRMFGPGLVVYLPMDATQLRHRHTRFPTSVKDRQGRPGQAIHFPGKGYLVLKDHPALDTDYQFTLAAWIYPTKIQYTPWKGHEGREDQPVYPWGKHEASWAGHFICCKWDSQGSNGDYIFAITPSGSLALGVADRNQFFISDSIVAEEKIATNQWSHVAATFQKGRMKLFVNGEQLCEKRSRVLQYTNRAEYVRDDVYIGDFWNNAPGSDHMYNFHGSIDEFCIFRKALSMEEICHLMKITE